MEDHSHFGIALFFKHPLASIRDLTYLGYFPHWLSTSILSGLGPCPPGEICSEFNVLWLVIDIVFWYIVSAFIISILKKRSAFGEKEIFDGPSTK